MRRADVPIAITRVIVQIRVERTVVEPIVRVTTDKRETGV